MHTLMLNTRLRIEFPLSRFCKMQRTKWYSGQMPAAETHRKACVMVCVMVCVRLSVPEMRIWSILLIKSDLKCIHLSRSLFFYFDFYGKFRHVKLLIKEKYPHTIITERYRFCCFNVILFHKYIVKCLACRYDCPTCSLPYSDQV